MTTTADTTTCTHVDTVPVEVPDPTADPGCTNIVAYLCTSCLDRLPAAWGCTACEWDEYEDHSMDGHRDAYVVLARTCPTHRGTP